MKRFWKFLPLIMALFVLSCAGVQQQWNRLTPDEKARVILNDMQEQLNTLFNQGKLYVQANPKHQQIWKEKIIPAFETSNRALGTAMELARNKQISPQETYNRFQPLINSVVNLLVEIGAVKK
ncbi:MAG: hypothetical protein K6T73_01215 [Candidatus Bathyarchaeota archaeon]|nr:hypothetical protein [Candidatus Bathyarchaeota archaeon]